MHLISESMWENTICIENDAIEYWKYWIAFNILCKRYWNDRGTMVLVAMRNAELVMYYMNDMQNTRWACVHAQHPTPRITESPQSLERWAETETYSDSLVWTPYFPLFTSKNHLFIKINVRREKININDIFYLPPPSLCRYAAAHTAQAFGEFPIERLAICATMLTCRHLACISSWK